MKYLLLILAVIGTASAIKKQMMETNRVMVSDDVSTTSCEECEEVVKKIEEAAKDPKKMAELKLILGVLCKETSYAEECRLFVSQLDRFIDKLVPYFKDPHAICARIHVCGNPRLDAFRKILLDFSSRVVKSNAGPPQIVCDECEFAMKEVKAAVENKELQIEVRDFLRNKICNTLGSYRGFCDLVVDEYLPEFIQQVDAILENPHQVCVDIHACNASPLTKQRKYVGLLGFVQRHFF